jgi:cytochrome c biogenesis protein
MSALEETLKNAPVNLPVRTKAKESLLSQLMGMLSSVRFGVIMLILLGLACLVGMLIMQENVDGFERYYAALTPAQRLVYGKLDIFDIYHSWYFNALLLVLSLNIILASIDRFPKTWRVFANPNLTVPLRWLRDQKNNETLSVEAESKTELAEKIAQACKKAGWRKTVITEKGNSTFVYAESGAWNRLGAYAVHVGLLTIFLGGFFTSQLGRTGQMPLKPGQTSNEITESTFELDQMKQFNTQIPFEVTCTDIQQKLIKKEGSISAMNTIDWLTKIQIKDGGTTTDAVVQMNRPFDYRGYRFFQASFSSAARARNITVRLKPASGGEPQDVTIKRDGSASLPDGTQIKFKDFRGKFSMGAENPDEDSSDYSMPAAILQVTPPNATTEQTAYAFGPELANLPVAKTPVAGFTYQLVDFEKVADFHILSVQRDPGATVVFVGFTILFLTLVAVFFFSHQRVWAAIEETSAGNFNVLLGGHTTRSENAFGDKFKNFIKTLRGQIKEAR